MAASTRAIAWVNARVPSARAGPRASITRASSSIPSTDPAAKQTSAVPSWVSVSPSRFLRVGSLLVHVPTTTPKYANTSETATRARTR